jgi:hypothetical protein
MVSSSQEVLKMRGT